MRFSFLLCYVIISCCSGSSFAQQLNIVIDSVRNGYGVNDPEEPCIAMDFKNTMKLVGGSNLRNFYTSTDGGYTWYKDTLHSSMHVDGDPVTIADTNGFFYYIHIGGLYDRIVCQRLTNITTHLWTDGSYAGQADTPKLEDKPWAVVDRKNNAIYLTWSRYDKFGTLNSLDSTNIFFSKSIDTGNTWSTAVRINKVGGDCSNNSKSVEGAMPCAGPNSEIYVAWAHEDAILFNRSFDGGNSWLVDEIQVSNSPGGWHYTNIAGIMRSPGLPFIASDNSNGPYKGTVYINWADKRNGVNNSDIWIAKSSDSGASWSSPIKVNNDVGNSEQFMSSMTVDPVTGYIYVLFYDRRNFTDSFSTDVYLAVSKDGAVTFQNFKISEKPFSPRKNVFFGDYTGVVAYNNIVKPIWAAQEQVNSIFYDNKIITAIIDSTITGTSVKKIATEGYNFQVYPNPFFETASIFYELPMSEFITLFITDITGRKIAIIRNNEFMQAGRHVDQFNADKYGLAQGIYFLYFSSKNNSQTTKIVLEK